MFKKYKLLLYAFINQMLRVARQGLGSLYDSPSADAALR